MNRRNSKQAGFTLIEVLVVVSILGVLMGLVSVLVLRAANKQQTSQTEMLVRSYLPNAIERYLQEMKRLPPMTVKELKEKLVKRLSIGASRRMRRTSASRCSRWRCAIPI